MTDAPTHDVAAKRLRSIGQRYTRGRRALVDALDDAENPLTVEQVREVESSLPQSSIYRNLAVLEEAAVVRRITSSDEFARFELAEDLTEHHHHLICSDCGSVVDFTLPGEVESLVDGALISAARRLGFTGDHHRLDLVGLCSNCS